MKEELKYLAIDSSNEESLNIILYIDGIFHREVFSENRSHLKFLIPGIKKILENNNLKINDLDFIALNEGPGSWTGLRISFATIKVLAMVNNLKVILFNNFELFLNENKINSGLLLIKASNSKYYFQDLNQAENKFGIINIDEGGENLSDTNYFVVSDKFSPHKVILNKFQQNKYADIFEMEPFYIGEGVITK